MARHGRYSVLAKIAEGGMAEIFLAEQEGSAGFKKPVILKCIRSALYSDPQFRTMFLDEAHICMGLSHSNIVQLLDLGEDSGRYFLALELVDGWSLDEVIKRAQAVKHELPPELALFIAAETCRALAYAHKLTRNGHPIGLVHRDVSPQNILLSEQGDVKLGDFGIAKAMTREHVTATGIVKGKLAFMSPEQATAMPLDGRSDLFSLGTVLYLLLTGKLPFQAKLPVETMAKVQAADFVPPSEVKPSLHPELNRIVMRAMKKSPKQRYADGEAMLLDLEKVMRNELHSVGRTELVRWLQQLQTKDKVPPISRRNQGAPPTDIAPSGWIELDDLGFTPSRPVKRASKMRWAVPLLALVGLGAYAAMKLSGSREAANDTLTWVAEQGERTAAQGRKVLFADREGAADGGASAGESSSGSILPAPAEEEAARLAASQGEGSEAPPSGSIPSGSERPPEVAVVDATPKAAEAPVVVKVPGPDAGVANASAAPPVIVPAPAPITPKPAAAPKTVASVKPKTPPPPPPAAKDGMVSVMLESEPAGATVRFNGRAFGKTPMPFRFTPGMSFELQFALPGFETATKKFVPSEKAGQKVTAYLKRAGSQKKGTRTSGR